MLAHSVFFAATLLSLALYDNISNLILVEVGEGISMLLSAPARNRVHVALSHNMR